MPSTSRLLLAIFFTLTAVVTDFVLGGTTSDNGTDVDVSYKKETPPPSADDGYPYNDADASQFGNDGYDGPDLNQGIAPGEPDYLPGADGADGNAVEDTNPGGDYVGSLSGGDGQRCSRFIPLTAGFFVLIFTRFL